MGIMPLLMSHKKVPHLWDFFDISRGCGPPHPTMPTCGSISMSDRENWSALSENFMGSNEIENLIKMSKVDFENQKFR